MIDIFILFIVLWAAFNGWRNGFVRELCSATGFLVGLLVASLFYSQLGQWLAVSGSETNVFLNIAAFLILWVVVPIVFGFIAVVLTKALKLLWLGLPNSILGALVSVAKYVVLLSCVFNAMSALHILNKERTEGSYLYEPTTKVVPFLKTGTGIFDAAAAPEERPDTTWIDVSGK